MANANQLDTLNHQIAPAAVKCEMDTKLPGEIMSAICILESGWLTEMPPQSNNPFGIKSNPHVPGRVLSHTHEWFTDAERDYFLRMGGGRIATLDASKPTKPNGKRFYAVLDYFATFESLADAFTFESNMLVNGRYRASAQQYLQDLDMVKLIRAIAPAYSTDDTYAATLVQVATSAYVKQAVQTARLIQTPNPQVVTDSIP